MPLTCVCPHRVPVLIFCFYLYNRTPLYGHSLNTDTSLLRIPTFLALNCSTRLIRTPVNADNGHLSLSCPISEFSQNANLANAETSLSTACCNRPFLFEGKKILQLTACRCSQHYRTPDKMICRSPFLPSNELCRE